MTEDKMYRSSQLKVVQTIMAVISQSGAGLQHWHTGD